MITDNRSPAYRRGYQAGRAECEQDRALASRMADQRDAALEEGTRLKGALGMARHWIVVSGAAHADWIVKKIDSVLEIDPSSPILAVPHASADETT